MKFHSNKRVNSTRRHGNHKFVCELLNTQSRKLTEERQRGKSIIGVGDVNNSLSATDRKSN